MSDFSEASAASREQLVSDLRRVMADAEALLAATANQSEGKLADLRERAFENLSRARERLLDATEVGRERVRAAAEATDDYVHANPWTAVGAGAALGLLVGMLLGGRR